MTAPAGSSPKSAPAGHVRSRSRVLIGLLVIAGVVVLDHVVGTGTLEMAGAGLGIAALIGLYVWRGPRIHKHLRAMRGERKGHSRTGSLNYPSQKGLGLRSVKGPARSRGLGLGGGTMGARRHRPAMAPFRRAGGAGLRAGSRRGTGLAGSPGRRRAAGLPLAGSGRRSPASRRVPGGSHGRLLGSRRSPGVSRRTGGTFPRSRRAPGGFRGSRGGSPGFRRGTGIRRGTGSRGWRPVASGRGRTGGRMTPVRRSAFRPPAWHRRGAVVPGGRGGRRPGTPRPGARGGRNVPTGGAGPIGITGRRARAAAWYRARRAARRAPYGTAAAGGWQAARIRRAVPSRRQLRHPSTWLRRPHVVAATGRLVPARRPVLLRARLRYRKMRRAVRRMPFRTPAPVRYVTWHLRGRPGMAGTRGTRRQAARAKRQAALTRLQANPRLLRHRAWYAPWRVIPGRRLTFGRWMQGRRSRVTRWLSLQRKRIGRSRVLGRWRRLLGRPRTRQGQPLGWRARIARWWSARRGRTGTPGTIRMGSGRTGRRRQVMAGLRRLRSRQWRHRPPRWRGSQMWPGFGWAGPAVRWNSHRRITRWDRYNAAHRRIPAMPAPRAAAPPASWHGGVRGGFAGTGNGSGTGGGHVTALAQSVSNEVGNLGNWQPGGATDLHGTLASLDGIASAVAGAFDNIGNTLEGQTGVHEMYAQELHQAAASIRGHGGTLRDAIGGGLTSVGGTANGHSPAVQGVIHTIDTLGTWDPGDDPEDIDATIQSLAGVAHSVSGSYANIGRTVAGTGAHSTYAPALQDASGAIGAVADEVQATFHGGVLRHPGGAG